LPVDKKHDLFFDVNDKKNKINSSSEKLYRVNDPNFNPIKP